MSPRSTFAPETAPVKTTRGRGSASSAASTGPSPSAVANRADVGDVGHQHGARVEAGHPLGERRGAGDHEVGAGREALLGGEERRGVDPLVGRDVVDAVVDDERRVQRVEQRLGLRHVAPEHRARPQPGSARAAPHEARQQPGVDRARGGAGVQRQHERRQDVDALGDLARRRQPAAQAARDPGHVAAGDGGAPQAQRLDEEDAAAARREAGHQVLLVRPQLGVPVGEPDADDVAAGEWGHSGGIRRSRMRSNSSWASS